MSNNQKGKKRHRHMIDLVDIIDISNLSEPIQTRFGLPRVMFAGEATDATYYGTTHAGTKYSIILYIILLLNEITQDKL